MTEPIINKNDGSEPLLVIRDSTIAGSGVF